MLLAYEVGARLMRPRLKAETLAAIAPPMRLPLLLAQSAALTPPWLRMALDMANARAKRDELSREMQRGMVASPCLRLVYSAESQDG